MRFGVDSPLALRLVTRTVRNRNVAVRVERTARDQGIEDSAVAAWLGSIPLERWPAMFGTGPSDALDLLDAISDREADLLRRLLDGEEVPIPVSPNVPSAELTLVLEETPGIPVVGLRTSDGGRFFGIDGQWQADLRTVLATGIEIDARLEATGVVTLRARAT